MSFPLFLAADSGLLGRAKEVGETFGFNGWLFLSQCFSFSLVCILLYKFAYKPILTVLEQRRQKIEQSLEDAKRIKEQVAASEKRHQEILTEANAQAQKMIDEARASVETLKARGNQQAIAEAEQIVAKAREQSLQDHAKMLAELRREVTRLVVDTTAKVTGKVLTPDDQRRLSEEASREIAA